MIIYNVRLINDTTNINNWYIVCFKKFLSCNFIITSLHVLASKTFCTFIKNIK